MPGPLTEADADVAFRVAVSPWFIERLDPGYGTARVVDALKAAMQCWASHGPCEDGPYSDGGNPEFWSRQVERIPAGVSVKVVHEVRATGEKTVIREGRVVWNQLANRATFAAIEHRRSTGQWESDRAEGRRRELDPLPAAGDEQTSLF